MKTMKTKVNKKEKSGKRPPAYFELSSPKDMLSKARREYQRLSKCINIDNVFNFFVTVYHIRDYIESTNSVEKNMIDNFFKDPELQICRDLCNKGKHLFLDNRSHDPNLMTHVWKGFFGGAPFGILPFGGHEKWVLFCGDGREVDVKSLAKNVLEKWERFFKENGL